MFLKRNWFALVMVALALIMAGGAVFAAVEVPAVSPLDFGLESAADTVVAAASGPEAHWFWTLIAGEIAVAIIALIGKVIESFIANIKNAKVAKGCRVIYDAVMVAYHEYVQIVKAQSPNGKMTIEQKNEALQRAYSEAIQLARADGFDLLKVFAKETVYALIEYFVGKSKGKAVVAPLPDLLP